MQVYVILFGVGSTDTEGIYSLRVMSREDGLPQDTIIAFSSKEDAERCAPCKPPLLLLPACMHQPRA